VIAVDLFSGAGGASTGSVMAGARIAAAVNHWPVAVETHKLNHPEALHVCQDVALLDARDLPAFDLLWASPACTGHSRARGKDRPHHDALRATAWCVVDVAEATRPKVIAVENVSEMRDWALYPIWRAALKKLGYHLREQLLCASAFGVPQERRRLFVTGSLRKTPGVVGATVGDFSARTPISSVIDWTLPTSPIEKPGRAEATLARIKAGRLSLGKRFVVSFYGSTRTGRSLDRPVGTLTTHDRWALIDGDRMRMLSVGEQLAAMGFPAAYKLAGSRAERVMQIGNAVSPPVARAVVSSLMEVA